MQSLPTEAGPLSHCSQCGKRVQGSSGAPTFVYGVGAVGHQSCAACGAKWRYLWQEETATPKRSRRPLAILGGVLLLGALGAVAVVAFRGSAKQYGAPPRTTQPTSPPVSAVPVAGDTAAANDFKRIFGPANSAKAEFMLWLATSAPSTGRLDVNANVAKFVRIGRETRKALTDLRWPEAAAADVVKLDRAYGVFLDDADLVRYGKLYSPSFLDQLRQESQAVKDAASAVKADLGPATP